MANMDFGYIFSGYFPKGYDKEFCEEAEKLLQTVLATLDFYDRLGDDVADAAKKLRQFVKRTDEAEHSVVPYSANCIYRGAIDKLRKVLEEDKWLLLIKAKNAPPGAKKILDSERGFAMQKNPHIRFIRRADLKYYGQFPSILFG